MSSSPFHSGEQKIQSLLGVRDKMERFGSQVIRDFMPDQHREFYNKLPFVLVGHADKEGWPWASIVFDRPGFISSKDSRHLQLNTAPVPGDPLADSLVKDTRLGLLGIELPTRRRNRLSGRITKASDQQIQLEIDQAFGNCPQYIQTRELEYVDAENLPETAIEDISCFDSQAIALIKNSDTFFVASYVANGSNEASEGVDVSHRGGRPGFIRVDDEATLTIPDYLGNFHFNTLGNFLETPKAGLLFFDFEKGHLLTLTGTVEILWDSPDTEYFEGAERLWRFRIDHGRWIKNGLPLRWKLDQYSPNTQLTGTWEEAEASRQAEANRNRWLPYQIIKIVDESSVIKSFHLEPLDGQRPIFKAGQFLTVRARIDGKEVIRTYTVSSAPGDKHFRISVKREGVFSSYLHNRLSAGDVMDAKAPSGAFTYDASTERPALLIAAGVGITPMVSMARHTLIEGIRTRSTRPLTIVSAAHNASQRAFFNELNEIASDASDYIRAFWALSQVDEDMKPGEDYHQKGRISKELLQAILPLDDYDCYLCGPAGFMQSMYDMLRELGICDASIHAEAFGPASLLRDVDKASAKFEKVPAASEAIVSFVEAGSDAQVEQPWSEGDGSLLEFAESHGLTPEYGCRSGQCGSCKAKLISGKVSYDQEITSEVGVDEVLLCCAVPAAIKGEEMAKITVGL
jgi:ferredoxin-NADP reductase/predicted pyridoxine 5'-phosphate oxidase superfamily flavin-nucleotide-binding protein